MQTKEQLEWEIAMTAVNNAPSICYFPVATATLLAVNAELIALRKQIQVVKYFPASC